MEQSGSAKACANSKCRYAKGHELIQNASMRSVTSVVSWNLLSANKRKWQSLGHSNSESSTCSKNKSVKIPCHIIQDLPLARRCYALRGRYIARLGLGLLQYAPADTAPRTSRVDALRVTTIFLTAGHTVPHVLVVNLVGVLCRYVDLSAVDRVVLHDFSALLAPALKTGAVGVVVDIGNHIVGEVAVLVSECVDESVFIINDLLGQLDRGMVSDLAQASCLAMWSMRNHSLPSPTSPTGSRVEGF